MTEQIAEPENQPATKHSWRRALPGIVAGAMAPFLPFARVLASEENRALFFFRHTDAWALIAMIGGLGVLLGVLWFGLTRIPGKPGEWLRRIGASGVMALVLLNLFAVVQPGVGGDLGQARNHLLLALLTVGIAAWKPVFEQFRRVAGVAARLAMPLPLILLAFLLTAPEYHESREPSPFPEAAVESGDVAPVYIFLFDGMDRTVAVDEPGAGKRYPVLHGFMDNATSFPQSISPGQHTYLSVPRLLFQTEADILREDDGRYMLGTDDEPVQSTQAPSIFQALDTGRTTGVVGGWYLDYGQMLGDQAGWIRDSSYSRMPGDTLWNSTRMVAFFASEYGFVPLLRDVFSVNDFFQHGHTHIARDVHEQALETIRRGGDDVVAFFHYPVPHAPYLFDHEGLREGDEIVNTDEDEGYRLNMEYADRLLGELLDEIRKSGRGDKATIIVTSDHGLSKSRKNVLVVKTPGQEAGRVVDQPFNSAHIVDWLRDNGLER